MANKWGRVLNWKRGPVSKMKLSAVLPQGLDAVVPRSKNLKRYFPPIKDQKDQGACVAFGTAAHAEFLQKKALKEGLESPLSFGKEFISLSEQYLYYHNREREGTLGQDSGSFIYTGVETAKANGFCRSSLWPYGRSKMDLRPSPEAEEEASQHRALEGFHVQGIAEMEKCIADGYPVIIGTDVCASFMNVGSDGRYDGPGYYEYPEGGHCMLLIGYSRITKRGLIRNSWGTEFGNQGYVSVPYSWMAGFDDCHTLR